MDDEKLKNQIGANIAAYRKRAQMTQAGLAEKLNYSDKAVSKWERGESAPDVITLVQLAELFGVTVNDMIKDPDELPAELGTVERVMEKAVEKTLKRKADKLSILGLIVAVISQIGDLTASIIKRRYGIKDYGTLFPGHGGILDRCDSVILVSPVIYLFLSTIGIF